MHWTEKSDNTIIIVDKNRKPKIKLEQTHKLCIRHQDWKNTVLSVKTKKKKHQNLKSTKPRILRPSSVSSLFDFEQLGLCTFIQ